MTTRLYLTPADHGRRLTMDEFLSAHAQEGFHYELIYGRLAVAPMPARSHDRLRDWLRRCLDQYAAERPEVINQTSAPARVHLPEPEEGPTAPEPDLACYRVADTGGLLEDTDWDDISPVLVGEILSPDTADKDLERNVELYLQVPSIREYWILDPRQGTNHLTMLAYRRRGRRWAKPKVVQHGETYTTPLLPGFELRLDPYS